MKMLENTVEKGSWEGWGQSVLCSIMAYWSKHRNVCFPANLMLHIRGHELLFHYSWDFVQNPGPQLSVKQTKQIEKKKNLKSKIMWLYNTVWLSFGFLLLELLNFQISWFLWVFFFFGFTISLSLYFPST